MDTPSFVNALRRFFAIRGAPKRLRSDRGTNFVGAVNQGAYQLDMGCVQKLLNERSIVWEFNPPTASHFGGVWERKIQSVRAVLDSSLSSFGIGYLSYEEFLTLVHEATAIVNSTPLDEIPSDDDCIPLTPAQLLTLRPNAHPPPLTEFTSNDLHQYGRERWRRVQWLAEVFWREWRTQHLQSLQTRHKWLRVNRNFVAGDIVLLQDKNQPRNEWCMARIVTAEPDNDGLVRKVVLKARGRSFHRPISALVLLVPSSLDESKGGNVTVGQQFQRGNDNSA
jgi:hypothetical protein